MQPESISNFMPGQPVDDFALRVDAKTLIRIPKPEQAAEMADLVRSNLDRLAVWMPWATADYSLQTAQDFVARTRQYFEESGRIEGVIMIDGRIAGSIGFHDLDLVNKNAHVGYWIGREHEGLGIVTKSCSELISYLFDSLELNRIQINCNVGNVRSRRVAERLGFKLEGIMRQVEWLHDHFGDWAVYGLLKEEWRRQADEAVENSNRKQI
jgi:ribosomal-protein-serine acetyltransferase